MFSSRFVGHDHRAVLALHSLEQVAHPDVHVPIMGVRDGYGWLGLAAAVAAESPLEGAWGAVASGVAGAVAFAVALAYRIYVFRRVRNLDRLDADL
jgi:hypothetical protein